MLSLFFGTMMGLSLAAHAEVTAMGEPLVTWTKRQIHVCWHISAKDNPAYAKNDFTEVQKKAVQEIVEKEYTEAKVGISFYGWENCLDIADQKYDLEIYQDNELAPSNPQVEEYRKINAEGYAVLGEGSLQQVRKSIDPNTNLVSITDGFMNRDLKTPSMYLMVRPFLWIFKELDELQATALHEFGHVAGLRHEHIREEAKTDPNCKNLTDFKIEESILDTTVSYSEYDPNSIMNYCWGATLITHGTSVTELPNIPDTTLYKTIVDKKTKKKSYEIRVGLSAKDIIALNKLYPKPTP